MAAPSAITVQHPDILTQFFLRIPAKVVRRLRGVANDWRVLVDNIHFIRRHMESFHEVVEGLFVGYRQPHLLHHQTLTRYFVTSPLRRLPNIHNDVLSFLPDRHVECVSFSVGLVCCRTIYEFRRGVESVIYVCNPLTRSFVQIGWPFSIPNEAVVSIIFDPRRDPVTAGVRFKIVLATDTLGDEISDRITFCVYSSVTTAWRLSVHACRTQDKFVSQQGVEIRGDLYWATSLYNVVFFDVQNEMSLILTQPIPTAALGSLPEVAIGESMGRLVYVTITPNIILVWVLQSRLPCEWDILHSISLQDLEGQSPDDGVPILRHHVENYARHFENDNDARPCIVPLAYVDDMLVVRIWGSLYIVKMSTKTLTRLGYLGDREENGIERSLFVLPYTMSLIPIALA